MSQSDTIYCVCNYYYYYIHLFDQIHIYVLYASRLVWVKMFDYYKKYRLRFIYFKRDIFPLPGLTSILVMFKILINSFSKYQLKLCMWRQENAVLISLYLQSFASTLNNVVQISVARICLDDLCCLSSFLPLGHLIVHKYDQHCNVFLVMVCKNVVLSSQFGEIGFLNIIDDTYQ